MGAAVASFARRLWLVPVVSALEPSEVESCILNLAGCIDILSDKEAEQEAVASKLLQSWLQSISAEEGSEGAAHRAEALVHLLELAAAVPTKPVLALGVGQALHSFFWWGDRPETSAQDARLDRPSLEVMKTALTLHEMAVSVGGCDVSRMSEAFLTRKCPWRWRFAFLIGSELALELAQGTQDFAAAAEIFQRMEQHFQHVRQLPYFSAAQLQSPMRMNQNWDFFPSAQHWPLLPRDRWPNLGEFMERHFGVFKAALEALLEDDPDALFGAAARFQNGLTPRKQDWSRIKLIHSGGKSDLCNLPYLQHSCDLLGERPEIGPRCGTYLSGASIARLLPGAQLKPHVGTYPRLTLQLGLRTPSGASLTVAGEEVAWSEGKAIIFDDSYMHKVQHRGETARYVLVAWFCHPCDTGWREVQGEQWQEQNPLPEWCGAGGPGYSKPPVPGYSDPY